MKKNKNYDKRIFRNFQIPWVALLMIALSCSGCATAKIGPVTGKKYTVYSVWMGDYDGEGKAYRRELQIAEYLKKHPKTNKTLLQTMLEGKMSVGMTEEQVLASWGTPASKSKSISWLGTVEMWQYGGCSAYGCSMSMVTFSNGKVSDISQNS